MNPTGSKIDRVVRCAASAVLPWDVDDAREAATEPARDKGKGVHAFLEQVKALGPAEARARIADPAIAALCRAIDLDNVPTHLATEVALAWNWRTRTGRYLGQNLGHRDYAALPDPPGPDEIAMTLDLMGAQDALGGRLAYVGDYKTGHTRYPRPGVYGQTLIGACAAVQVLGARAAVVELLYLDDHGACWPVRDRVDEWVLGAFADELAERMEGLPALRALYASGAAIAGHAGPHCANCGAYKHCSTTTGLVRHLPAVLGNVGVDVADPAARGPITVANAGALYVRIEQLEDVLASMKDEICKLGFHHPIDLPDGRRIEPVAKETRKLDPKVAFAVLQERYGHEAAMQAMDFDVTFGAVERVVSAHLDPDAKPRQTITGKNGVLPRVLDEIDRRGGLIKKPTTVCRPYMPKKKQLR